MSAINANTANTATTANTTTAGKAQAPAPKVAVQAPTPTRATGAGTTATTKAPKGSKAAQAAAPQAPLFIAGTMPPVRPGTHRAYAQGVARALSKGGKGFTLAQYRAALVAGAAASSIAPPNGGWAAHNMPTWASNPAQAWLVPVAKK